MKAMRPIWGPVWVAVAVMIAASAAAQVVFEATSPYHNIRVEDRAGMRLLTFDGTLQTRMSLADPLSGHFEYIEYFHLPWLWNTQVSRVLMIGLGGGSAQRQWAAWYPEVQFETVEIDPVVVRVAREYFGLRDGPTQKVIVSDGRLHVRRSRQVWDVVLVDAYTENRYGAFIPYHLATREFFGIVQDRLSPNGVMAYNAIGTLSGWQSDVICSLYRTMTDVFPQVYLFPAQSSHNVVLIATREARRRSRAELEQVARHLQHSGRIRLSQFLTRVRALRESVPSHFARCGILTDDYAPVDGLLTRGR
ncbi:MAG: fused MFS/spermidine synthase [Verrucomicrobiota bacterium]|nr:fused MFS/spermidine synthase [Limisphaera sp.]MDW8382798.1 fused MFS/spermidine synthase [Verrucomicrobiota bacterium]